MTTMRSAASRPARAVLAFVFCCLAFSDGLLAQGNSLSGQVRALSNQLLRIHKQLQTSSANESAPLRSQAIQVILQRDSALAALIEADAAEALRLALPADLLANLAADFPEAAARLEQRGQWQGSIEYLIEDMPGMANSRSRRRMRFGQSRLDIHFAAHEPPGLKSGDLLVVRGVRAGQRVAAADGEISGSEVAAASCGTSGAQSVLAILVNFQDYTLTSGVDQELVNGILYGNAYTSKDNSPDWSVDDFWQENSDGATWAPYSSGKVVGPYTLPGNYNEGGTCNDDGIRYAAIAAADPDVNFNDYSRLLVVMPQNDACGWAGLGSLGCWSHTAPSDGSFTASITWQRSDQMATRSSGVRLTTHEFGHNLTMHHASSRDFESEALGPLGVQGTLSEYGDKFSTMGSWNFGLYSAHHAEQQLGWFSAPDDYRVVESGGTFSISPYEQNSGLRALKIRRGTGNDAWVWLEYRQNLGIYDSQLYSQVWSGALIHYEDSITGSRTHLLDFTPGTSSFNDPALAVGQTWNDPYSDLNLSIDDDAGEMLTVTVSYTAPPPCSPANPTVTLSPLNQSAYPGETVEHTVTVTNNDSATCAAGTFSLASSMPGWNTTFTPPTLNLSPAAAGTSTMSKTAPADATVGVHDVDATATKGAHSGTGTASVTVIADTEPPNVTLTNPADGSTVSDTISMTATASDNAGMTQVAFLVDGATVCTDTTEPYSCSWDSTTVTDGPHAISAEATDWSGNTRVSAISATVDNEDPTVALDSPAEGGTVSGAVTISATANDNVDVSQVAFLVDGATVFVDTTAPYIYNWDSTSVSDGPHTITAEVSDGAGHTSADTVSVTVDNVNPGDPVVTLETPGEGTTVSGTVNMQASATDNKKVQRVRFFVDGVQVCVDSKAPYRCSWDSSAVPDGPHTANAMAEDQQGNKGTDASSFTVSNDGGGDTEDPTATVTSPVNDATVSGTVPITATASDNVSVTQVVFKVDGAILCTDGVAPYECAWDTTAAANSAHTITAEATDAAGNTGADSIGVTVENASGDDSTPPAVTIEHPQTGSDVPKNGRVTISATASDNEGGTGVASVSFSVNDSVQCTDTAAPYNCTVRLGKGTSLIEATAVDRASNSASHSISISR